MLCKFQTMPTLSSTDPVLETQVFWDRHKKAVFAALFLALLAIAVWGGYRVYSERREATAANSLTAAKTAADFQKVIAQYPGTAAGESAYLFLAEEQRKEKKIQRGERDAPVLRREVPEASAERDGSNGDGRESGVARKTRRGVDSLPASGCRRSGRFHRPDCPDLRGAHS